MPEKYLTSYMNAPLDEKYYHAYLLHISIDDDFHGKYLDINALIRLRFSYYSLFHPQFSRKDIGTGSIAWSCLDICKLKDSLDHLQLISDVHLKE